MANIQRGVPSSVTWRIMILSLVISAMPGPGSVLAEAAPVEAQWEVYQVRFRYTGMSSHYTCQGMENTLKRLLRLIGARDDMRVEARCSSFSRIERFQRVNMAFALPVPRDTTDISDEVFPAEWQEVRVSGVSSRYLDDGDCELLEEFERQVMPKLNIENTGRKIRCVPFKREFNRVNLRVKALIAQEQPELEERPPLDITEDDKE